MRFSYTKSSTASTLFVLLIGGFIGWESSLYYNRGALAPSSSSSDPSIKTQAVAEASGLDLDLFWDVYALMKTGYVETQGLDPEKQMYGAIKGLVNSVDDPYSVFMTPEESQQFQQSLEGELQGIGAELTMKNDQLVIIAPLKGSPAETIGLKPGDIIYKINGEFVADMTLFEAIMKIRGPDGTTVKLTVFRNGNNDPMEFEITRSKIEIPSVELKYVGEGEKIAHLVISQFGDNTETEFDKAVQDILLKDVDGVVLDMRFNGGGYLDVAVDILSDLLEGKKKAVVTKTRDPKDNEIFYTNESGLLKDFPLVVLVNKGSASASEIVAGAVQDYERGTVMGEQTFGKGSVQVLERFEDGSNLRLTVAKWYTPNDRSINDVGIMPNTIVVIPPEDAEKEIDTQLNRAVEALQE